MEKYPYIFCTHARTHARTHAHTRMHARTHAPPPPPLPPPHAPYTHLTPNLHDGNLYLPLFRYHVYTPSPTHSSL